MMRGAQDPRSASPRPSRDRGEGGGRRVGSMGLWRWGRAPRCVVVASSRSYLERACTSSLDPSFDFQVCLVFGFGGMGGELRRDKST